VTLRAVVDTNVLVSGLGWAGPPATVVDAALSGSIQLVTTQPLLEELRRVLEYPRLSTVLRTTGLTAAEIVALVADASVVVVPIRPVTRARDADDNRVLEAAVTGRAEVIISGDVDLQSLHDYEGLPILSASEFVARMLEGS
jgi:putative PIN family toxin of toxin-antitoxin system